MNLYVAFARTTSQYRARKIQLRILLIISTTLESCYIKFYTLVITSLSRKSGTFYSIICGNRNWHYVAFRQDNVTVFSRSACSACRARYCYGKSVRLTVSKWINISSNFSDDLVRASFYRPLADGTVRCPGSATYQICLRLPIPNPNPNPITDPNPNPNNNKKKKTTPE